jgi:hypothetical protein
MPKRLNKKIWANWHVLTWRHDIQHNDTQHSDTQHSNTQDNDIQHNNKWNATLSTMILNIMALITECHYAGCHYAECHYVECRHAECRGAVNMVCVRYSHRNKRFWNLQSFSDFDFSFCKPYFYKFATLPSQHWLNTAGQCYKNTAVIYHGKLPR